MNDFKRTVQHSLQIDIASGTRTVANPPSIAPEPWPPAPPPPPSGDYWLTSFDVDYTKKISIAYDSDTNPHLFFTALSETSFVYQTTIKLATADAAIIWQRLCAGESSSVLNSVNMGVDSSGNVYSGYAYNDVFNGLTKYDSSGSYVDQYAHLSNYAGVTYQFLGAVIDTNDFLVSPFTGVVVGGLNWFGFELVAPDGERWGNINYGLPQPYTKGSTLTSPSIYRNSTNYYSFAFVYEPYLNDGVQGPYTAVIATKLDLYQNMLWSIELDHTGTENIELNSVSTAIDNSGDIYVAYGIYLVGDTLINKLVKLDGTDGSVAWAKELSDGIASISVSAAGTLYAVDITGRIMAFDGSGALLWCNKLIDTLNSFAPSRISVNDAGFLVVAGRISTVFAAKLPSDGSLTGGTYSLNGHTITYSTSTASISSSSATVTGITFPDVTYTYVFESRPSQVSATTHTNVEVPL